MKMSGGCYAKANPPNTSLENSASTECSGKLTIAFWNVHKNPNIEPEIVKFAISMQNEKSQNNKVILGISEIGGINISKILKELIKTTNDGSWKLYQSPSKKFVCYSNAALTSIQHEAAHGWPLLINLRSLDNANNPARCAVWFVHLRAPMMTFSPENISIADARYLHEEIINLEGVHQLDGSIAIGDFNADPYSDAMLGPDNLNAVMCQRIASAGKRVFYENKPFARIRPYFYNPMWNSFGDQSAIKQPGSFYRGGDPGNSNAWHLIDQVLLRPSLMHRMIAGSARVMVNAGSKHLLDPKGRIDASISDHLPIAIEIKN